MIFLGESQAVKETVRLDKRLVAAGLVESRERAKALILAGKVSVGGKKVDKPGVRVPPAAEVAVEASDHPYVSRGGLKLEKALSYFGIDPRGLIGLDVGASTGGFTHCLLMHGAAKIYAVDVGYGQCAWSLRNDPRVVLLERTNIRYVRPQDVHDVLMLAVIDVSFISLKKVLPAVFDLLGHGAHVLALVKPQFEVGKGKVGKGGVVRNEQLCAEVLADMDAFCRSSGWQVEGTMESPIRGAKGNREFFLYLRKPSEPLPCHRGKSS